MRERDWEGGYDSDICGGGLSRYLRVIRVGVGLGFSSSDSLFQFWNLKEVHADE